jgi:hypothetical protein
MDNYKREINLPNIKDLHLIIEHRLKEPKIDFENIDDRITQLSFLMNRLKKSIEMR